MKLTKTILPILGAIAVIVLFIVAMKSNSDTGKQNDLYLLVEKRDDLFEQLSGLNEQVAVVTGKILDINLEIKEHLLQLGIENGQETGSISLPIIQPQQKEVGSGQILEEDKELMGKICEYGTIHGKISPLCDNYELYNQLKLMSETKGVPFRLMLGISYAESHIGTNFSPQLCSVSNNWSGLKGAKMDTGKVDYGKFPTKDGCWVYNFQSVEQFWHHFANTLLAYQNACGRDPACISIKYVGGEGTKPTWINRVKIFYS